MKEEITFDLKYINFTLLESSVQLVITHKKNIDSDFCVLTDSSFRAKH